MIIWTQGLDGAPNPTGYDVIVNTALVPIQPAWVQYEVTPPNRVWSGVATVQLQFPDRATAQSVLAGLWADDA